MRHPSIKNSVNCFLQAILLAGVSRAALASCPGIVPPAGTKYGAPCAYTVPTTQNDDTVATTSWVNQALDTIPFTATNELLPQSLATRAGLVPNLHNICNTNMTAPVDCSASFTTTVLGILSAYHSARIEGTPGDFYYFASSLTLPSNLTVDLKIHNPRVAQNGVWDPNVSNVLGLGPGQGGIILATGASIVMQNNDTLEHFIAMPSTLVTSPTSTAALTEISNFAGTGILASGSFDTISDGTVIGFADGIDAEGTSGRFLIRDYYCDNTTCLRDWNGKDYSLVDHIYANNLYTRGITYTSGEGGNPLPLVYRTGAVVDYENSSDDLVVLDIQDYGHNTCANIAGSYISHFVNPQCEVNINGAGTATTHGFVIGPSSTGTAPSNSNVDISGGDLSGRTYEIEVTSNGTLSSNIGGVAVHGVTFGSGAGGTVFFVNLGAGVAATFEHNKFMGGPAVFNVGANTQLTATGNIFWNSNTEFTLDPTALPLLTDMGNEYWGTAQNDPYAGMAAGQGMQFQQSVNGSTTIVTIVPASWVNNLNLGSVATPWNQAILRGKLYAQTAMLSAPSSPQVISGSTSTSPTVLNNAFGALSAGAAGKFAQVPDFNPVSSYYALSAQYNKGSFAVTMVPPSTGNFAGQSVGSSAITLGAGTGEIMLEDSNKQYYPIPVPSVPLSGTSGSIGGSLLVAGACANGTLALAGATNAMAVEVTPVTFPGNGAFWEGWVSSAGTVTVEVCESVSGTPTASAYNVRVLQ